MPNQQIQEGFGVFAADGQKPFGAVRKVAPVLTVYVENAGDFVIPAGAVKAVHQQKVIVDVAKLDVRLRQAIGHAHDAEDPRL